MPFDFDTTRPDNVSWRATIPPIRRKAAVTESGLTVDDLEPVELVEVDGEVPEPPDDISEHGETDGD